jgi:flagellar biosynthesis protein FlhB
VRSTEINSALLLLGTFGALALAGAGMGQGLLGTVRDGLSVGGRADLTLEGVRELLLGSAWAVGQAIWPVVAAGAVAGILANVAQVGFQVTPQAASLNWAKLDPLRGLQGILSARGGVEAAKALCKLAILGVVAHRTLQPEWGRFSELAGMELLELVHWQLALALRLAFRVTGAYLVLAAADFGYQWWQHEKGLRMSRNEILEEGKQQEGNPQVRARVRSLQQDRRRHRMMQEVPTASVVVVNPTHIAVALKYAGGSMRAPRVVAKGKRLIAERIVALARQAGVPVIQDIPLARTLYKLVDIDGEIPAALYRAVARILAYVYARDPRRRTA